jgi:hypothetical protein
MSRKRQPAHLTVFQPRQIFWQVPSPDKHHELPLQVRNSGRPGCSGAVLLRALQSGQCSPLSYGGLACAGAASPRKSDEQLPPTPIWALDRFGHQGHSQAR